MNCPVRTASIIRRACVETLESRQLFSVSLDAGTGIVLVKGTSHDDQVIVSLNQQDTTKLDVSLNGATQEFDTSTVNGLRIATGKGNDHVLFVGTSGKIDIPATILGGVGNDQLFGGSGNDSIVGGGGRDTIDGGAGDDVIDGGLGGDSLAGGSGDDQLTGDAGSDHVDGGGDSDIIKGGKGSDNLSGADGDDDLDGGKGSDQLTGGDGADAFAKGTGGTDTETDKTAGVDREYQPFPMEKLPQHYLDLFHGTFPNCTALGYRLNDDQTFTMIYRFAGDQNVYHAYFSFEGTDPFANLDGVSLDSYEVAPTNLPPMTLAQFQTDHPDATIKEVFAFHVNPGGKMAHIRFKVGDAESEWTTVEWLDNT